MGDAEQAWMALRTNQHGISLEVESEPGQKQCPLAIGFASPAAARVVASLILWLVPVSLSPSFGMYTPAL